MATLSAAQVYALARKAGLGRSRAIIATAIATAESSRDTNAHNAVPPDDSYGLWQINMIGGNGPARRGLFGLRSNNDLFDPRTNARVMAGLSAYGLNFGPWTTYTRGTYKQYLGEATTGAAEADQVGIDSVIKGIGAGEISGSLFPGAEQKIGGAAGSTAATLGGINTAVQWLSTAHNWWRIAGVMVGGLMILIAVMAVLQPALEPALRATPAGRVALAAAGTRR